jgi:hypothetical protein
LAGHAMSRQSKQAKKLAVAREITRSKGFRQASDGQITRPERPKGSERPRRRAESPRQWRDDPVRAKRLAEFLMGLRAGFAMVCKERGWRDVVKR